MKVLVIGNGFDIAHGLRTSYYDFLSFIKDEKYKNKDAYDIDEEYYFDFEKIAKENGVIRYVLNKVSSQKNWVDLEFELRTLTEIVYNFFSHSDINIKDSTPAHIDKNYVDIQTCKVVEYLGFAKKLEGIGETYFIEPLYYSPITKVNWHNVKKHMRDELDTLKEALIIYLACYLPYFDHISKESKQIKDINPDVVFSFNYTEPPKGYGLNDDQVVHIHGSLKDKKIVLGYNDNNPTELTWIQYKKYFQKIQYQLEEPDLDANGPFRDAIVHFYGHSLDKTDGDFITDLFNCCSAMVVYYYEATYEDTEDYEQKVANLIDILGKECFIKAYNAGKIKFEKIINIQ